MLVFPFQTAVPLQEIPLQEIGELQAEILEKVASGWRIIGFFGYPAASGIGVMGILARGGELCVARTGVVGEFRSLAEQCPQIQVFERELYEQWRILPRHHPWLKPVRRAPDATGGNSYDFYTIKGTEIHQIAVGPVHAGIIEPGHFRFLCYGENVYNLEIALGYQHRGLERKIQYLPWHNQNLRLRICECIAGDASVAHATAHCVLLERLLRGQIPEISPYQQRVRRVGLELERLACHCGDLGAIAGDTGFLPTSSWNGRIRGDYLNLTAAICGNRFGREYLRVGGSNWTIPRDLCQEMLQKLDATTKDAIGSCEVMFSSSSVRDRMTGTGSLTSDEALALGLVGVAARACGVATDARFFTPLADLPLYNTEIATAATGDVLARAQVRFAELRNSHTLVASDLRWLQEHRDEGSCTGILPALPANTLAVAQVESWRGEICHIGLTDAHSGFAALKMYDPSFHNWPGLALAMRGGQISDFPLCNKSFNLSYCGHDL